jgi:DNA-binding transcriptional LysR family regulator
VTVSVTRATSISLLGQITKGVIDLGLTYLPTRLPKMLRVEVLDVGAMVLVSNPDHRLANRSSVSLQDLRGENFVKCRSV